MHSPINCLLPLLYMFFIVLLHICSSVLATVDLHQTIPQQGLSCPGDTLQYTCTSSGSSLILSVGSSPSQVFTEDDSINATLTFGEYVAVLVVQNTSTITATITNESVMSDDSGTTITCAGDVIEQITVAITDGPANCSSMSVVPVCQITTNAGNSSEPQVMIALFTDLYLMCVARYVIQFNGKNTTVPVSLPVAVFLVTISQGEPFDYETVVYTLDYENRTGQIPCVFDSLLELSPVANIDYVSQCDSSLILTATFSWMEPSVLGTCSFVDMLPQYTYFIDFSNPQFGDSSTRSTSYQLRDAPQGSNLEITITPALPSLGLTGPPLSSTVNLVSISCFAGSSSTTLSPITSPGAGDDNSLLIATSLIFSVFLVLSLVLTSLLCIFHLHWIYKYRKSSMTGRNMHVTLPELSARDSNETQELERKVEENTKRIEDLSLRSEELKSQVQDKTRLITEVEQKTTKQVQKQDEMQEEMMKQMNLIEALMLQRQSRAGKRTVHHVAAASDSAIQSEMSCGPCQEVAGCPLMNPFLNENQQSYARSEEETLSPGPDTKSDMVIAAHQSSTSLTSINHTEQSDNEFKYVQPASEAKYSTTADSKMVLHRSFNFTPKGSTATDPEKSHLLSEDEDSEL